MDVAVPFYDQKKDELQTILEKVSKKEEDSISKILLL